MSKMGQYVFEMEEAAKELSREAFILKYGKYNADVWDNVYNDYTRFLEPEYDEYEDEPMADN